MRRAETQESMLSPADLVNGDPVDAARVAAAPSGALEFPQAAPPMTRMVAGSARTASGVPAKMISPRSIT